MNLWLLSFKDLAPHLLATGSFLVLLIVGFLSFFLIPGILHQYRLAKIQRKLRAVTDNDTGELKAIFSVDRRLTHLWNEYLHTLHAQKQERGGQTVTSAIRSTVPADTYFNSQYVVDSRLRTDFFKHLPGIFTGIGIIGTFSGLIQGLRQFQVTDDAGTVRKSLEFLLHGVNEAFFISAVAISAAMIVTLIEKLLLTSLHRRTEEIAQDIDARFNAGAGEEYLSRLVIASEDSASQSKILKDALVKELGQILRELTESQIGAIKTGNAQLSSAISSSIKESLDQPMKDIAATVKTASGDQSAGASRMLQDVLSSFSEELRKLFGGQISGINELNQETVRTMQEAVRALNALVGNLQTASETSGNAMAERMAQAIEKMELRQESINSQTASFVEQIKQLVATSQTDTNKNMQDALMALGQQVGGMVDSLRAANEQALEGNRHREQNLVERTSSAVTTIAGSVEAVVKEMAVASTRMQDSVSKIAQVTTSAVDRMNSGADTLNLAARNFAQAGDRVTGAIGQAATVSQRLSELSGAMTGSSTALQEIVRDYRANRDAVSTLVTELRAIVDSAKKEASLTQDVLSRIQSSTDKLIAAQGEADRYLEGVSEVLGTAHQSFADAVTKTLDRANSEFHKKLSSAVALLSSSIQELDTTIGSR